MAFILELEAKSVEKAVKLACDKLEIPREELNYDVISHGSSGIFGIGRSKKAKIRVVLPEEGDETVSSENISTDTTEAVDCYPHTHASSICSMMRLRTSTIRTE